MIYFDNSATTRCCDESVAIMTEALQNSFGNPSSLHNFGLLGENYIKDARAKIAKTLKCQDKEIYFTSGGTEGNNLLIKGVAKAMNRAGKHVITTAIEHASVSNVFASLEKDGFEVSYLSVDEKGVISLDELKSLVRPDTILVSLMMVNNEIGALEPIEEAGAIIKEINPACLFHVDAIQSYGKFTINPKKMNIDMLSVSGHKIHGPKGSGFVYIRDKVRVIPQILGGGQENGMRSGTENVPAIAGLGEAARIAYENLETNRNHLYELRERLIEGLTSIDEVSINGSLDRNCAPHIVSVSVRGVRAEVLLHSLEDKEIYVSAGSACSSNKPATSKTLIAIGLDQKLLDSTVRISFCPENTFEEVDECIAVFKQIVPMLAKYARH